MSMLHDCRLPVTILVSDSRFTIHHLLLTFTIVKLLVIRLSSIGDIVLTSPVVRCIKQQRPEHEIHFLTKKNYAPVIIHNPYIDRIHLLRDWKETIDELRNENFDAIIDLHHNRRTRQLAWSLKKPAKRFYKANIEKWLMVNFKWDRLPKKHIVDRYLETVNFLGVMNDGGGLDYFISKEEEVTSDRLPSDHSHGFVTISIGGNHFTKKWTIPQWKSLSNALKVPVVILGGPEDQEAGEEIASNQPTVFNGCGKFSLNESASLIRQSLFVITHDTGMMHIAAAFGKKIISIWGNTIPEFGMYPYYGDAVENKTDYQRFSKMVEVENLPCRPCSKIGYDHCPEGHFRCMQQITESDVLRAIEMLQ